MVRHLAFLTAVLALSRTAPAHGQITFDGCINAGGVAVASIRLDTLPDVAMATADQLGRPLIYYNPHVLAQLHSATRLFFYAHECGHHRLAHTFAGSHPLTREQAADCWGIRELVSRNLLTERDIDAVQSDLSRSPGDWTHLPGPYRAINLRACLGTPGSSRVPCAHPAHPMGDQATCSHPLHPAGDIFRCSHPCAGPYGWVPCHPAGDIAQCTHPAHAADVVPCRHVAHPSGP